MIRKLLLTLALILSLSIVKADYIPQPGTQDALDKGACDQYKVDDRKLNEIYQAILNDKAYAGEAQFLEALKTAERQWIKYRDAEVDAIYPGQNKKSQWGSVYPMCACSELQRITRQRMEELQRWHNGIQEGDVCAGSSKLADK
jgi:uncharacterized protein YecT (DUF1311 family)